MTESKQSIKLCVCVPGHENTQFTLTKLNEVLMFTRMEYLAVAARTSVKAVCRSV